MSGTPFSNASLTGATTISGSVSFAAGTQISGLYKRYVGLGLVDNTSDMDKPVSTAVQGALNNILGNASVLASKPALDTLSELATAVEGKAPLANPTLANPTFTGTVKLPTGTGIIKSSATGISAGLIGTSDITDGSITAAKIAAGVSLQGPQGPAGTNGTNGATGPQGPQGAEGATITSANAVNNNGLVTITFTKSDNTTFTCNFVV